MAAPFLDTLVGRFIAIEAEYQTAKASGSPLSPIEDKVNALYASLQGRVCLQPEIETSPKYQSLAKSVQILQASLADRPPSYASSAVAADTASVGGRTLSRNGGSHNLFALALSPRLRGSSAASPVGAAASPFSARPAIACADSDDEDDPMPATKRSSSSITDTGSMFPPTMPDIRKRGGTITSRPDLGKLPGVSIEMGIDGKPLHGYNIHDSSIGYAAEPIAFLDSISSLSTEKKKELKRALEALNQPIFEGFLFLSISADVVSKITGRKVPASWSQTTLSAIYARLSDVSSESPTWGIPPTSGYEKLHKQIRYVVENHPSQAMEFESSIRALLILAPYLIPSYATMLATQAYHKINPMTLSPIIWTQEPESLQLHRILYFIHTKESEGTILSRQIASLEIMDRANLRTMLHSILAQISGLTDEQRTHYANIALRRIPRAERVDYSLETIKAVYASLEASPLTYPLPATPDCEGFDVVRANVQAAIQYVGPEALRSTESELRAILFAVPILPPDLLRSLTNAALARHGFPPAYWTDENPAIQILRFLHFAKIPELK